MDPNYAIILLLCAARSTGSYKCLLVGLQPHSFHMPVPCSSLIANPYSLVQGGQSYCKCVGSCVITFLAYICAIFLIYFLMMIISVSIMCRRNHKSFFFLTKEEIISHSHKTKGKDTQ